MEHIVKIVGTGPGDGRYVTPLAREVIEAAQVLVGGQRQLEMLASQEQERFVIGKDLPLVLEYIKKQRQKRKVVVLASGDSGLYSIGAYLVQHLSSEELEFIPGISSVQVMFARLKRPWHDVQILSMHGRGPQDIKTLVKTQRVSAILTGGQWTPQAIASLLLQSEMPDVRVAVGQALSYPEERLVFSNLSRLMDDTSNYDNSVMVIFNE